MAGLRIRVDLDRQAIRQLTSEQGGIAESLRRAGGAVRDRARANITQAGRVDTGKMRQSIARTDVFEELGRLTIQVGSDLEYALYQHEGTDGPIFPRTARVLRFKPKGASTFIFRPSVSGVTGVPFLRDALDDLSLRDFLL